MAKAALRCVECDHRSLQWMGRCPQCGAWESFKKVEAPKNGSAPPQLKLAGEQPADVQRWPTGILELDRIIGGGLVRGSVVLLAGEPGIGKSTLMVQAAGSMSQAGRKVVYVCGEESPAQVSARASRLGVPNGFFLAETSAIEEAAALAHDCDVLVLDSIQTARGSESDSPPGSVTQVRESAAAMVRAARESDCAVVLVGHVTKDGSVAGPRVLEHVVDAVLLFEGDRGHGSRLVRGVKNRFGSTGEVGVFEMTAKGLEEVKDASALALEHRGSLVEGCAVGCILEGRRPIAAEIQALIGAESAVPRRIANGIDQSRLGMLAAVIESRAGINLSKSEVYASIAGGWRVNDPGIDLAIVLAVAGAKLHAVLPPEVAAVGEVGLGGEVRAVPGSAARVKELERLGFTRTLVPKGSKTDGVAAVEVGHIRDAVKLLEKRSSN